MPKPFLSPVFGSVFGGFVQFEQPAGLAGLELVLQLAHLAAWLRVGVAVEIPLPASAASTGAGSPMATHGRLLRGGRRFLQKHMDPVNILLLLRDADANNYLICDITVAINGQTHGPYPQEEIASMVRDGRIACNPRVSG